MESHAQEIMDTLNAAGMPTKDLNETGIVDQVYDKLVWGWEQMTDEPLPDRSILMRQAALIVFGFRLDERT